MKGINLQVANLHLPYNTNQDASQQQFMFKELNAKCAQKFT